MSLINCVECHNQISDKAEVCPHCGYKHDNSKVTIKNTYIGKKKIIIGKIVAVVGSLYLFSGIQMNNSTVTAFGAMTMIAGIIILSTGRFQHWWNWK